MEQWKELPGWEKYEVSSLGRMRRNGKILKGCVDSSGYLATNLSMHGKRRYIRFHVAVLETFVGPRGKCQECRHLDGDPENNSLANLMWGSAADNSKDQIAHGTRRCGEKQAVKLTDQDVIQMRLRAKNGEIVNKFASEYGITQGYARAVVNGSKWKHLPGAIKRKTNGKSISN